MSARSVTLAALAFAVAGTACQPPAQEAAPLSEVDVAAITSASQAWAEAYGADDDAGMLAFSTQDLVLMPPDMPLFQGLPAAEEYLAGFTGIDLDVTRLEIEGRGDLAYERSTYVASAVPAGATEAITYAGKYVNIWRKQADGSWLISICIFNSDEPIPWESVEI
jgi:ketosteroid isomerase-like protein